MFNKEYVLTELRNGRSFDAIMDEMSEVLNEAAKAFEEEQARKNYKNKQIKAADDIIDYVYDYMIDYYGTSDKNLDKIDVMFKDVDGKTFIKAMEQVWNLSDSLEELTNSLANLEKMFKGKDKKEIDPKGEINIELNLSDLVDDLLKTFNN